MAFNTDLTGSTVEAVLVKLLSERAMYGYEIIKLVNERTSGAFAWKEGTLYPCLHRLEADGVVAGEWQDGPLGKPRKYYKLTRKGKALVTEKVAEWRAFSGAMDTLLCS